MLYRSAGREIENWLREGRKALMVTGARQTGKTYLIREMCKQSELSWVEFNLIDRPEIIDLIRNATDGENLKLRLTAAADRELIPGETVIFLDEIQEYKEIATKIKFLVDEGSFRYILSGSLLGVELHGIQSAPVGYLSILRMFPMDFYEFAIAAGLQRSVLDSIEESFRKQKPVDDFVHGKLMELFDLYLIVGGMPQAEQTYVDTHNVQKVQQVQNDIRQLYYLDFTKYADRDRLKIREIYDTIPSELNKQNKRFIFTHLNKELRFERYENSFLWLKDAGVAIPVYLAEQCKSPLEQSRSSNLFKLFNSDVGMLDAFYPNAVRVRILNHDADINNGALFENAVAQQLLCNGFTPYYFKKKTVGEVDFLIEKDGYPVPIEIKSGKDYRKHAALDHLLAVDEYPIQEAYVFCRANVSTDGKITYLPIYMLPFLRETALPDEEVIVDLSGLGE